MLDGKSEGSIVVVGISTGRKDGQLRRISLILWTPSSALFRIARVMNCISFVAASVGTFTDALEAGNA